MIGNLKEKSEEYNGNVFIKITEINKVKSSEFEKIINETFKDFKGLTHYELIRCKRKKFIVFYYINNYEWENYDKNIEPKHFKLEKIKKWKSCLSNNIYVDLKLLNGEYNLTMFLKGKLIYCVRYSDDSLYETYVKGKNYILNLLGLDLNVVENRDDAFKIYSNYEDERKIKYLIKGGNEDFFKEEQKL